MQQFMRLKMNLSELPNLNMAVCNTVYYQICRFYDKINSFQY